MKISAFLYAAVIFPFGVISSENNADLLDLNDNLLSDISEDYPIECMQYHVFQEENLEEIVNNFQISVSDLSLLNPELSLPSVELGTPLCVVGKVKVQHEGHEKIKKENNLRGKTIGNRSPTLVQYETNPNEDSCQKLFHNTEPPLSHLEFVELNPHVSCEAIQTTPQTVFLPEGTVIVDFENDESLLNGDQDCLYGAWSDWTICEDGTKTRERNIYREARGGGKVCPIAHEMSTCESDNEENRNLFQTDNTRALTSSDQCLKFTNGCSVPSELGEPYAIFTPACNFHDICWSCTDPKNWGISKIDCDAYFKVAMKNTCAGYWQHQPFDRWWCEFLAESYFTVVTFVADGYEEDSCPHVNDVLNSKLEGRYIGYSVPHGCSCEGKSCLYRGEKPPCWNDGTICGAGTTCNKCCNGSSWWTGKAFTACGNEPCWGRGTVCGAGTTCNSCCNGADCPWYQFGICTCN